jgi:ribonucleoside-diphosphate reductase alpha chain
MPPKKKPKRIQPELTANALEVLQARYLIKDSTGKITETPAELFERVAAAIAKPEKKDRAKWEREFYRLMAERRFLPNSPTLMNAGKPQGQLSACFVLPIEDDLSQIFDALKQAALIHQSGGGTGFSFSRLRTKGSIVNSSRGTASGPVSFMRIFDTATETIKQGGVRRGANMAILRVDHPDIAEFIDAKRDMRTLVNFNISVAATDEFMRAVERGDRFALRDPRTKKALSQVPARELFSKIAQAAWACGDPGMVFIDRINQFNPTPKLGPMESTNPCGEQPLLPYESCNLGSINVAAYMVGGKFDWKSFRADIHTCVRFLDNVIDENFYPVKECEKITLRNRKIGLGIMGFADLLLQLDLP